MICNKNLSKKQDAIHAFIRVYIKQYRSVCNLGATALLETTFSSWDEIINETVQYSADPQPTHSHLPMVYLSDLSDICFNKGLPDSTDINSQTSDQDKYKNSFRRTNHIFVLGMYIWLVINHLTLNNLHSLTEIKMLDFSGELLHNNPKRLTQTAV